MLTQARLLPAFALALAIGGCSTGQAQHEESAPPVSVPVSHPLLREVIDHAEFAARTSAIESVKVRARVWGHIDKVLFTEGSEVKKGAILFLLDRRPYAVAAEKADAEVGRAEARVVRLSADHERMRALGAARAASREEADRVAGELAESRAAVLAARAALESARLDLLYTEVRAPISGQVGRAMMTAGNLISTGDVGGATLTTLVSVDPVHAYFDVDDLASSRVRETLQAARAGKTSPRVMLGLAAEKGFPHEGTIDFVDNQVDAGTGTLKARGVFRNPDRKLTPGLFGRVRVALGSPRKALLVADRAVDTDQGQKVVYVVASEDVIERRPVELGAMHDGLREIVSGLGTDDRIVVGAIQRVRAGVKVAPRNVDMPSATERKAPSPPVRTKTM